MQPTGTVTFLFTDIEGSTRLAQKSADGWEDLRKRHNAILQSAITTHNGYTFQVIGDAFCAAFSTAKEALCAAVAAQLDLFQPDKGDPLVKVRMGIHTGQAEILENGLYQGYMTLSRTQRIMSAGHGGQVLLSLTSQELTCDDLPQGVSLRDLGLKQLKDLIRHEHIHQVIIENLPSDFPPLKTLDIHRHNLPAQLTSFIGREKEMAEIILQMGKHRLITLTGSGGTGKTRLSLQVAAEMVEHFPDGVWFIELAPITDPDLVPQTILSVLDIGKQPGRSTVSVLKDYLRAKELLLILDNCEHLIEACAKLVVELLANSHTIKILASSREALGVDGEQAWHVPSLNIPDIRNLPAIEQLSQYEAVRLFIERTLLTQPHFTVNNDNAPAIAQICYRLDGIPLAIELAAARVKVLNTEEIASRLDDRFRLLTGGSRSALPRQQTLRATIDWSYGLLSENEKVILQRLSVFLGGWNLESAEQVCSSQDIDPLDVLDLLGRLVDKSLVMPYEVAHESRYHMLESVRQYAREKLMETGDGVFIRNRHAEHFLSLAEKAGPQIYGGDQFQWLNKLENDHDNLRAALDWTCDHDINACLRLATVMWRFWDLRSYNTDAHAWVERLLDCTDGVDNTIRAQALVSAISYLRNMTEYERVKQLAEIAATLAESTGDKVSLAIALRFKGETMMLTDNQAAHDLFNRSLELCRQANDPREMGIALYMLGVLAKDFQNDLPAARTFYEEGLIQARLSHDMRRISLGLAYLAGLDVDLGDLQAARDRMVEALELVKEINDTRVINERLSDISEIDIHLENYDQAEQSLLEVIRTSRQVGDPSTLLVSLFSMLFIYWARKDLDGFKQALAEAFLAAKQINNRLWLSNLFYIQAVYERLSHNWVAARQNLSQSLQIAVAENIRWTIYGDLASFAILAVNQGENERAARLFGVAQKLRDAMPPWKEFPVVIQDYETNLTSLRLSMSESAFLDAFQSGKEISLEVGIEYALRVGA